MKQIYENAITACSKNLYEARVNNNPGLVKVYERLLLEAIENFQKRFGPGATVSKEE